MKFVERSELDPLKWDELVDRSGGTLFSKSFYLDAIAEKWCVYVDDSYSKGIALPYVHRMKQKVLYTPIFLRYLEWFGDRPETDLFSTLKKFFDAADFSVRTQLFEEESELYEFQEIPNVTLGELNEQARRMLKKFNKSNYSIQRTDKFESIITIIQEELSVKIEAINSKTLPALHRLIKNAEQTGNLVTFEVLKENSAQGGAFFLESNDRIIYLKSAFKEEAKKEGAMYALMKMMIDYAKEKNKHFDFGGSRVSGVKRFNHNLGGEDVVYFNYKWNHHPLWFKTLKWLRDKVK